MKIKVLHNLGFDRAKALVNETLNTHPDVKTYRVKTWVIDEDEIGFEAYGTKESRLLVTPKSVVIDLNLKWSARMFSKKIESALRTMIGDALSKAEGA